jgi:hypothetical protein
MENASSGPYARIYGDQTRLDGCPCAWLQILSQPSGVDNHDPVSFTAKRESEIRDPQSALAARAPSLRSKVVDPDPSGVGDGQINYWAGYLLRPPPFA